MTLLHLLALCFVVACFPQLALCGGGKGGDPADMDPMDLGWSMGVAGVCCAILGGALYGLAMHNQRNAAQ